MKLKSCPFSRYIAFFAVLLIGFSACQEDTGDLGINVLPVTDSTTFNNTPVDSTTIRSYTVPGEEASKADVQTAMLGAYTDPVFGETKVDFALKFFPSSFSFPYDENTAIDSIKLFLTYSEDTIGKYFGVRSSKLSYTMHPLETNLRRGDLYDRSSLEYKESEVVGQDEFAPLQANDTLYTKRLNNEFALALADTTISDSYSSSTNFNEQFRGVYLKLTDFESPGAIAYFDPYHNDSKIRVYYRDTEDEDTTHFDYNFQNAYEVNMFSHDRTGTPVAEQLNEEPLQEDSISYIQSMGGTRTLVRMPHIKEWRQIEGKTVIINKAELIVEPAINQQKGEGNITTPYELVVMRRNEDGIKYPLDEYLTQEIYLGETKDEDTNNYYFNITNYVQKIIKGELPNYGLYLMVRNKSEDAGRILINGGNHQDQALRLEINYGLIQ